MKAYEITKGVYWVGAIDWNVRNFHGYETKKGSTYNAYLIVDEKIAIFDTVKAPFAAEMLERVKSVVDLDRVDYIISNHVEMDHTGALPVVAAACKNAQIITSTPAGIAGLKAHYGDLGYVGVKTGDSLSLGKKTVKFVQTPMVHWPDSMVSYIPEDEILFSNDAFGQHYASSERMDEEVPEIADVFRESDKYYANIVLPYAAPVTGALNALGGLPIKVICPMHGIMWKKYIPQILERYEKRYVRQEGCEQASIVYDSMWGSTDKIAHAIASGFEQKKIPYKLIDLKYTHNTEAITEVMLSKYVCVGSPTLNNGIMPTVASFLCYMKGLAPKPKKFLAFGSYGWSGQSPSILTEELTKCKFTPLCDMIRLQYVPTEEVLQGVTQKVADALEQEEQA